MHKFQTGNKSFWKRLSTNPWVWMPKLNPHEQTRASWARRLTDFSEIPSAYQPLFAEWEQAGREFPYTVLVPSFEGFFQRSAEKLVCDQGDGIAVLEKSGESCQVTFFPYQGIHHIAWTEILLEARLSVSGITRAGSHTTASLCTNAVTDYLLLSLVVRMRCGAAGIPLAAEGPDSSLFSEWAHLSYKFMNYARRSLLPGEQLVQAILQLEVRQPAFNLLGWTFFRTLAPSQALLLTDRELVLIREEALRGARDRYGGTWEYLPLGGIVGQSLVEDEGQLLRLKVETAGGQRLYCQLEASRRQEVEEILELLPVKMGA